MSNQTSSDSEKLQIELEQARRELEQYNHKVLGASPNRYFCVFRVGRKLKNLGQVASWTKHMARDMVVPNADPEKMKYNRIIIGDNDVTFNVNEYIKDVKKIRSNANLAYDLVLSGGNGFFDALQPQEKEKWIEQNIKFLKDSFGSNCVYACLHMDETTPHIHALIIPKFWNEEKRRYELSGNKYFDGVEKMRSWQDRYYESIHDEGNFNSMMRGIRGSKTPHTSIQAFYSMTSGKLDMQDDRKVLAYAQYGFLLRKRTKALEHVIVEMQENGDSEKLLKKLDVSNKTSKIYKDTIKEIMKKYGVKEKEIFEIMDQVQGKGNNNERGR